MIAGRRSMMHRAAKSLADAPKKVRKRWEDIDPEGVKSSQLAELYEEGDPIAARLVADATQALGAAIGSAINLLSPEVVVIGGGVAGALGESFLEGVWAVALRYA